MELESAFNLIDPRWQSQYLQFIETGEAEDAFLEYLNKDKNAQTAVDMAFDSQAQAFEGLAKELKMTVTPPTSQWKPGPPEASKRIANAVQRVLDLPPQYQEVAQQTIRWLKSSSYPQLQQQQQHGAREVEAAVEAVMDSANRKP